MFYCITTLISNDHLNTTVYQYFSNCTKGINGTWTISRLMFVSSMNENNKIKVSNEHFRVILL